MKLFALTAFTSLIAYASAVPTLSSRSTELVVRANSTLTTCQAVTLDWASDLIPAGENIHWEISAFIQPEEPTNSHQVRETYPSPLFQLLTPSTSALWNVDYPAGTLIQFNISGLGSAGGLMGASTILTVQEGNATDCIPQSHLPIVVTVPDELVVCAAGTFSWTGGVAPYNLHLAVVRGQRWDWSNFVNVTSPYKYTVDYPINTTLEASFTDSKGVSSARFTYDVVSNGDSSTTCIPSNHYEHHRPAYLHPGAIAGYVILGLLVVGGIVFVGVRAFRARRNNNGVQPLAG